MVTIYEKDGTYTHYEFGETWIEWQGVIYYGNTNKFVAIFSEQPEE